MTERSEALKTRERQRNYVSAEYSLGLTLNKDHQVSTVVPGGVADQAGITEEMEIVGINGKKFSEERFRDALEESTTEGELELLLLDDNETFHSVQLSYEGGPRYPSLSRLESPDWLSEILEPKVTAGEGESN